MKNFTGNSSQRITSTEPALPVGVVCGWTVFIGILLLLSAMPAFCADSSTFRGNAQHSGVYDAAGVPKLTGLQWAFHTQGQVISSPAVDGALVYVGSTRGNLYAVDRAAGTEKWHFEAKSRIASSPAVSNGQVYFGAYDGNFYAVDASTGKLSWKFQTGGERRFTAQHLHGLQPAYESMPDPWDCYLSSPVVSNGAVNFLAIRFRFVLFPQPAKAIPVPFLLVPASQWHITWAERENPRQKPIPAYNEDRLTRLV